MGITVVKPKPAIRTRRMPKRFKNNALPKPKYLYEYMIMGLNSNDFKKIEKTWKIFLPFNKKDLEDYTNDIH